MLKTIHKKIEQWSIELGFQQVGITDIDLSLAEKRFQQWIDEKMHGEMSYMSQHGLKRSRPNLLEPGTLRVISVRMDYFPEQQGVTTKQLEAIDKAYVSRYALGRDYHKLMRKRLQKLAKKIQQEVDSHFNSFQYRVFVDSAPILEKPLAEKAGLGWIGKHTNLINKQAGSWFFIGEIYSNIPIEVTTKLPTINTEPKGNHPSHCGTCTQCIQSCPTDAIVSPYRVDARKCISYLTIELKGSIPIEFRHAMGNRIYGCDDCQLVCPWNKFSQETQEVDFKARHQLDKATLLELYSWSEQEFLSNFEGSPIRRIGYQSWLRNISIALGNYLYKDPNNKQIIQILKEKLKNADKIVSEHIKWALEQNLPH